MMQKGTPTTDRIGSYRVIRELSVMGSVQVHLACEDAPGTPSENVVLKVVPNAPGRDAKDTQKLIRELTVCSRMTHPGIVRTRKVFKHADAAVLVVEHVDGISLAELLAEENKGKRFLSDDAVLLIGLSICDALAHAHATLDDHRASIVHRAVSPSNILVGRDGSVKLDGFGFANVFGGVGAGATDDATWTPAYMAPEQVADQTPTPKVDVYAVALILWELLSGRKSTTLPRDPFAIEETLKVLAARKLEPLATLRPDLPEALSSAVDAALASEPDQRHIGCAEMGRCVRKMFQFARARGELRDCVNTALARPSRSERRRAPRIEPPKEPNAPASAHQAPQSTRRLPASAPEMPASAPRLPASAPRAAPRAPRLAAVAPEMPASAPHKPEPAPQMLGSAPRMPVVAPRALHHTLVGIAPSPLEVAVAAPPPLPAAAVSPPPPDPSSEPNLFSPAFSEPMATDVVMEDPEDRAAVPPPFPVALTASRDEVVVAPAPVRSETDRVSGPHSADLAVTADKLPAAPAAETSEPSKDLIAAGIPQRLTLSELLRAPTPWRRSTWVAAWLVLVVSLGGLVVKVSSSRAPASSGSPHRLLPPPRSAVAAPTAVPSAPPAAVVPSSPPAAVVPSSPPQAAALAAEAAPHEGLASAAASPPQELDESSKKSLLKRGLGLLTIHSTASQASVYVNLHLFGVPEERLTVPCGKQFLSIGVPPRRPGQPVWLAPGKSIVIPCGGAHDETMNPRALR